MPAERRKYIPSPLSQSIVGRRYRRTAFGQLEDDGHDTGPKPSPFLTNVFSNGSWSNSTFKPNSEKGSSLSKPETTPCPMTGNDWIKPHNIHTFDSIAKAQREVDLQLYGRVTAYVPCGIEGCPYCTAASEPVPPPPSEEFIFDVRVFPDYEPGRVADMPKSFRPVVDKNAKGDSSRRVWLSRYFCRKEHTAALNTYAKKSKVDSRPYDKFLKARKLYWDCLRTGTGISPVADKAAVAEPPRPASPTFKWGEQLHDRDLPLSHIREPEDLHT